MVMVQHAKHYRADDTWIAVNWHPIAVMTYLFICLMDFVVFPGIVQVENARYNAAKLVELATEFHDGPAQIEAIHILHEQHDWDPLTLRGNGLFHIAFGGIISMAAYSRGRERVARIAADQPTAGTMPPVQ